MRENSFKMAYIVAEGHKINAQTSNILDTVIALLAAYYVFDLNYPAMYGQFLGFLQQFVLEEPYIYFKGTNFQTLSSRIKSA